MEPPKKYDQAREVPKAEGTSCLNPVRVVVKGVPHWVGCRKCKRCQGNSLTNFAGRCYAEALTADYTIAVTLTYADSADPASQTLVYRDIQLFLKRLRKKYRLRYVCAGEYGSKRGRAHWHIVLFFYGDRPDHPPIETERQMWARWWPHGFAFFQRPSYRGLLYVIKYMHKGNGSDFEDRNLMMSKKPPLGAYKWADLARLRVRQGLPFSRQYTLEGATYQSGEAIRFFLSARSLSLAYDAHRVAWLEAGNRCEPPIHADDYDAWFRATIGAPSVEVWPSPTYREFRDWALERQRDGYRRNCAPLLTLPDGFVYRLENGSLLAAVRRQGMFTRWLVHDLAALIALVRGRSVASSPPVRKLGTNLAPF